MPNKPLLAQDRPSSEHSHERAAAEDDALLGYRNESTTPPRRPGFWRELGLFVWAVAATAAVIILGVLVQHRHETKSDDGASKPTGKRNLIFMVSDGMGPASLSLTRSFRQFEGDLAIDDILNLDQHLLGQSRTRSSSSLVTDSAAGATAFSCGRKSYNGAISMLDGYVPCGTVLEAAKRAGYMTGLVVTTDLTDATPACFASHVNTRGGNRTVLLLKKSENTHLAGSSILCSVAAAAISSQTPLREAADRMEETLPSLRRKSTDGTTSPIGLDLTA